MSHAARALQLACVTVVCFLLAPSKLAAIAYSLVIGGLFIVVLVALGIVRAISSAIMKIFRSS